MLTIYKHEFGTYLKTMLIWLFGVAGMGLICILLYSSMQADMESMAESFASMGAFADAFGMSQMSIATMMGFYATEVGTLHGLGSAMFAAIISCVILSKEEEGHTGEFLYTMPIRRGKVVVMKWLAVVTQIILFNILAVSVYVCGILSLGEEITWKDYSLYHGMLLLLQLEVAAICFAISAFSKKNRLGIGLGVVLVLYGYDMMARVIPDLSDYKLISPYAYANAADIFSTGKTDETALIVGMVILVISFVVAYLCYTRRDLAS